VLENATGNRSTPYHTIAISPAGEAAYVIGGGGKTTGRSGRVAVVGRCKKSDARPEAAIAAFSSMTVLPRSGGWRDGQPLSVPKQP
jgi:hypothetical protein